MKILALWFAADELEHAKQLDSFWNEGWVGSGGDRNPDSLRVWTRATRAPGHYTLTWDGKDEEGHALPRGRYRIRIDVNREHGPGRERHTVASVDAVCGGTAGRFGVADQPELADVIVSYGPEER